jgi:hypothetical protein
MGTILGGVSLDRDMVFDDEYNYKLVNASVEPTVGGGVVVQEFSGLERGRLVTLSSTETMGMQQKSTIDALKALADVAGATYTLTITSNNKTFTKTVRFRNEVEGGPLQFEPFHPREGLHSDTIYYKGSIQLMVI